MSNDNEEPEAVWLKRLTDEFDDLSKWQVEVYRKYAPDESVDADRGDFRAGVVRTVVCLGFQNAYLFARGRGFEAEDARTFVEKRIAPAMFGRRKN